MKWQPERLNPKTLMGCDSLNFAVMQRESSEEEIPPNPFECTKCGMSFDPSDWQNDVCDECLYKRKGHKSNRMQAITQDTAIRNLLCTRASSAVSP